MYNDDAKSDEDGNKSRLLVQQAASLANVPHFYLNNPLYNQALNYSPSILNFYHGNQYPPPLSPCFLNNAPLAPSYINTPGLPQYGSSPGFLTGAGYQLNPNAQHSGGLCLPGIRHPGQEPLHAATIVGNKQRVLELVQDNTVNLDRRDRWGRVALVYAVLGNYSDIVEVLLLAGARPDAVDAQKRTPLHFATYKGNHAAIKSLLHAVEAKSSLGENQGGVWLAQDSRGVTPLHHAAHHSNQKCLQALLKYASPGTLDTLDHKKRTPLHWAAAYGSDENVKLLIKHGANNLLPDHEGKTPLHWAAMSKAPGAKGCVRTLIGFAPSSVNWQDFDGITALHLAVAEARLDAVDIILSVPKCNVDLTDNQFRTALHWACSRGVTTIVGRLLNRGAHPGAVDLYGATPLHYAAQLNHADTVELLVRRPCVRDDPSKEGHTALLWAAARGADSAITAMVKHGASLTKADPRGCTALHVAAGAGHISTVGVLLRLKAPVDIVASDGRTPLLHAAQAGHAHIVKHLAKNGASMNHRDDEGQCALHHAVLSGHLYLTQILIKAGTSVNVRDYSGRTPLHMAAYRGLCDIMFLLLENRGDVNARDHEGQSPLHWAAQQGHLGAVNTLLEFHAYPNYTQTTDDGYTPLDCAYVAEQLEVAQVLMEAGGLSVTKIRDIAAVRIQAMVRGYLSRRTYKKLKSFDKMQGEPIECIDKSRETQESACRFDGAAVEKESVSSAEMQNKKPPESKSNRNLALDSRESTKQDKCKNPHGKESSKLDTALTEKETERLQDIKSSGGTCSPKSTNRRLSPMKSLHLSRRSKAIGSNIKLGARKKTFRELKLPDPGELGIQTNTQDTENSNQSANQSFENEDPPLQKPQTVSMMGEAFRHPRNLASILVSTDVGNSSSVHDKDGNKHVDDTDQKNVTSLDKSRHNAHCKADTSRSKDSWQEKDILEPCLCKNQEDSNKEERKRLLHEGFAKSLEVAHKEAKSASRNARSSKRQILSATARKEAEEKWSNKLASLTVQVQRPNSAKASTSFSYNLASPAVPHSAKSSSAEKAHSLSPEK